MKWFLTLLLIGSLYGQGFGYNYIDPCNQQAVNLNYTTETTANGFGLPITTKEHSLLGNKLQMEHYKLGHNKFIEILKNYFLVRST